MVALIRTLSTSILYWWLMLLICLSFEAVALFYQHVLDYGPCPLCIHVRVGIAGLMLVTVLALFFQSTSFWRVAHLLNMANLGWLCERAYLLLGTEGGFVYLECGVDSGLPPWLPLDQWLPSVFLATESCGYTPNMLFGISMAEALIVVFPFWLLANLVVLVGSFIFTPGRA